MKKFKLVLATSAVLLGSISVLATSNFTKGNEGFTLTSAIEGNKEVVGVKRAMVEEGDKAVFTEGEGTSLQVSPAMTQVVTNEDGTTNLRFVAAVKADLTGSAVNAVKAVMPGDVGFHVSYGEKDVTYDVEHAYSSMVASGNFYYANEYSSWYGENGTNNENNKPMTDWLTLGGFEDNKYNLFIALEVQDIPADSLDTLFKVQTYVRNEDGTYEYSKYTKLADAKGSPLYWLSVDGTYDVTTSRMDANPENETVAGKDEYMKLGVSLTTGQTVSVVDSYCREHNTFKGSLGYEGTEGYVVPRDGSYDFYYKTSNNTVGTEKDQTWVTEQEPILTYSIDGGESILLEGNERLELTTGQTVTLYKDKVLIDTVVVEKDSTYALSVSNDKLDLIDLNEVSETSRLYLVPNANWKLDNARFAINYFGTSVNGWLDLTKDPLNENRYYVDISEINDGNLEGITIIFCRMNPNTTENNWYNKWNQTSDLTIPAGQNCYTVKEDTWDKGGGEWSLVNVE